MITLHNGIMRKIQVTAAVVLSAALLTLATPPKAFAATCSAIGVQPRRTADLIRSAADEINDEGFAEFKQLTHDYGDSPVALSPLSRWYLRFIVSMGSRRPPSQDQKMMARAFTAAFSTAEGRDLASQVWVNDTGTSYDEAAGKSLSDAVCTDTVISNWQTGTNLPATVDELMSKWVVEHHAISPVDRVNTVGRFIGAINWSRYGSDQSNHPFNALVALSESVRNGTDMYRPSLAGHYAAAGVRGFRFESRSGGISLYAFLGSIGAIQRFQAGLDEAGWANIERAFKPGAVKSPAFTISVIGRLTFDPGTGRSFGTRIVSAFLRPALEQFELTASPEEINLSALAGVEGYGEGALPSFHEIVGVPAIAHFEVPEPLLYIMVDDSSGAILSMGSSVAWNEKGK